MAQGWYTYFDNRYKNLIISSFRRVGLIPENPEDMWHAYNLISHGDTVRASTIR